MFDQLE